VPHGALHLLQDQRIRDGPGASGQQSGLGNRERGGERRRQREAHGSRGGDGGSSRHRFGYNLRLGLPPCPQFERTLIIAEEGSHVSYLEGCTAPAYDSNQLHAAVVELSAAKDAEIKYSTVQNW
jgi:hypothetical protein